MATTRLVAESGKAAGRLLFFPPMEPFGAQLMAAVFRSAGCESEVLHEDDETLAVGLKHTSGGECMPCPTTLGSLIKTMRDRNLPPERVAFFMPTACGPCRFGQYSVLHARILERLGWGAVRIMSPAAENSYEGMGQAVLMRMWHAMVMADVMRKMALKIRPYEVNRGETDRAVGEWVRKMVKSFENPDLGPASQTLQDMVTAMQAIPRRREKRPLVGVVGEIYVRLNPFANGNVLRRIEELGGEAVLAPASEWVLYTNYARRLEERDTHRGFTRVISAVKSWLRINLFFEKWERHYYDIAEPLLHDRREPPMDEVLEAGSRHVPWEYGGEAILTLGRAELFVKREGCRALVSVAPMFCMPGTVTASILPRVAKELDVPVVCNFYDGSGDPNRSLVPVMHYLCEAARAAESM